jgi:outer membrane protein assembly factor BamB
MSSVNLPHSPAPRIPLCLCRVSSDVLIVSLLDGHVVALDQSTGRTLWSFDSGAPLVSAKQSFASSQGLNVFPGTDGGLYAYHGITNLNPGLEVRQQHTRVLSQTPAQQQLPCSPANPVPPSWLVVLTRMC